jgi:UDP-N-acetylglucosamine 2-epimerase
VGHDVKEIISAIRQCEKIKKAETTFENPYGDGKSSTRIVELLKNLEIGENIIQKRITY